MLRSITDCTTLQGKRVLVRVDHNVEAEPDGTLKDDGKLRITLPTIQFLLEKGARLILLTHVGRPEGKVVPELSTSRVAAHLHALLPKVSITHLPALTGRDVAAAIQKLRDGEILYLENIRFTIAEEGSPEEQTMLATELASLGDLYVNEAFASCHNYEEASTCALARLLPGYAGLRLQEEVETLGKVLEDPRRPLVVVMGGAKMKTKIPVIRQFLGVADHLLLGGCLANTFLAARGFDVGASVVEPNFLDMARDTMLQCQKPGHAVVHVPRDVVVSSEEAEEAQRLDLPIEDIEGDMRIVDIGKVTTERYGEVIAKAGTIVWNGPLGRYEYAAFSRGTLRIADAVAAATTAGARSIVGGGDTLDFHRHYSRPLRAYSFVSSGGGAMLEFLGSPKLPALAPLTA